MIEVSFLIYFIGIMTFLKNRFHIITVLLRFEFIYLGLFLFIVYRVLMSSYLLMVVYLIMIVAEARLGLRLLVIMRFFYGNDQIISINLLKC